MSKNSNIPDQSIKHEDAFVTWQENDPQSIKNAQDVLGKAYASTRPVMRSQSNFSVRMGMDRNDYEVFRPGEAIPKNRSELLAACVGSYERVSPIKNIIDMMVDFTTQGIKLVHPNPQIEQTFQNWFEHVRGTDRSQHFANNFYLMGTAIVKRTMAKLSARVIDDLEKGLALSADSDIYDIQPLPAPKIQKYVVPYQYDFLNPALIALLGGDLALFAGKPSYGIQIPLKLFQTIKNPRSTEERELVAGLPQYILDAVRKGSKIIQLDDSRLYVAHYKKNDWQAWGTPILTSVMDDIILLQKMKLTDLAALDGAISHIRIWQLGSLEHKIMPTKAAFDALNEVLVYAGNGESFDLIWGPDLTFKETTSDISKYLGQEKYVPVLSSIYSGLGIPPTLVGGASGEKGFTNNFLSMKTLIERLNYGRDALVKFWNNEIKLFQQSMQFRFPAQVAFKHAILTDEAAFNSLLVDLLDRDVISASFVIEQLGYLPDIQNSLLKSEWKSRDSGKLPPKAGPFHDPQQEYGYKKIFAQTGTVTPSELGIELETRKKGETPAIESRQKSTDSLSPDGEKAKPQPKGVQFQGRPKNSKDTTTRKTKRVVPRTAAGQSEFINLQLWAKSAQESIAEIVHPVYLKMCNKKNMRQLTTPETEDIERLKFSILCNLEPDVEVTQQGIAQLMQKPLAVHPEADNFWKILVSTFMHRRGVVPTVEEIRQIQSYVYALYKGEYDGENND